MVKCIVYKGKEYPVRLSYLAIKMTSQKLKKDITTVNIENFDPEQLETMLFYGLKSGANAINVPFIFEESQMEAVLDEVFLEFAEMVPLFFAKKEIGLDESVEDAMEKLNQIDPPLNQPQRDTIREAFAAIYALGHEKGNTAAMLKKVIPQDMASQ